jgi:hypothetical protein
MTDYNLKIKNKYTKSIEKEAEAVFQDILEDMVYRNSEISSSLQRILPPSCVESSFSNNTTWVFNYEVDWTSHCRSGFNKGLLGLFLEGVEHFDSARAEALQKLVILLKNKIINRKPIINLFIKRSLDHICGIYKDNTYILDTVDDCNIFFDCNEKGEYFPFFVFTIRVKKVK